MNVSKEGDYMKTRMVPKAAILVEPTNFELNEEAMKDNEFMKSHHDTKEEISKKVYSEHKGFQSSLEKLGVNFRVYKQMDEKAVDSIYTCDWFCTIKNEDFPEGIFFLFPMKLSNRRIEKNPEIIKRLKSENKLFFDLTKYEEEDKAFEGFGSSSLDFHNRVLYVSWSDRNHKDPIEEFLKILNENTKQGTYKLRLLDGIDPVSKTPIFHTGMFIAFNDTVAFLCKDFIIDPKEADKVVNELANESPFKYQVVLLSYEETINVCANIYEIELPNKEKTGLVMSKRAYDGFSASNREFFEKLHEFIVVDCEYINHCGGGSVRCMSNLIY